MKDVRNQTASVLIVWTTKTLPKIYLLYSTEETKSYRSGMGVNDDRIIITHGLLHKSTKDQHF